MRTCCGHCAILYVDVYTLNLATRKIWGQPEALPTPS